MTTLYDLKEWRKRKSYDPKNSKSPEDARTQDLQRRDKKDETTSHKNESENRNDNPATTAASENKRTHPRSEGSVHF